MSNGRTIRLNPDEVYFLQRNRRFMTIKQLAKKLNLHTRTMYKKLKELKIPKHPSSLQIMFTEDYNAMSSHEVARLYRISLSTVYVWARKFGLKPKGHNPCYYKQSEIEFMKQNYSHMTKKQLAKELNRSLYGITYKIDRLKLTKSHLYSYSFKLLLRASNIKLIPYPCFVLTEYSEVNIVIILTSHFYFPACAANFTFQTGMCW